MLGALALVGALIGFGSSFVFSPGHYASSKVLLKGQLDKNQLLTETQIAVSLSVLDRVADDLHWGVGGVDLQRKVSATVLDGNVLEITGIASTADRARELTDRAAAEYVTASTQILNDTRQADENAKRQIHDAAQKRVDDLQAQLADAEAKPQPVQDDVVRLTTSLNGAKNDLAQLDRQAAAQEEKPSSGTATILEPALDHGRATPTPVQLVAGGAVALPLLGLYGLMWATRRGGRLRDHDQIEAALGAAVLGDVTVAAADLVDGGETAPSRGGFLARLVGDGEEPSTWVDPAGETTRYRRALARIGGASPVPLDVVLVVARDDSAAQAAVVALAAVAAAERGPVRLAVEDPGAVETYRRLPGLDRRVTVTAADGDGPDDTVFRVVDVDPARPTITDRAQGRRVLLVTGSGVRTSGELVDISGACLDAAAALVGALLVTVRQTGFAAGPGAGRPGDALVARSR